MLNNGKLRIDYVLCCSWSALIFLLQLHFPASRAQSRHEINYSRDLTPWLGLVLPEAQFHNTRPNSSVFNIHFVFSGSVILTLPPLLRHGPGQLGGLCQQNSFLNLFYYSWISSFLWLGLYLDRCSALSAGLCSPWAPDIENFREQSSDRRKWMSCDSEEEQTTGGPDEGREPRMPAPEREGVICKSSVVECQVYLMLALDGAFSMKCQVSWHVNS